MKFNTFELITPAIQDTKKLLLPFDLRKWMKLGLVAMLSGNVKTSGGVPSLNIDIPDGSKVADTVKNETVNNITGSAVETLKQVPNWIYSLIAVGAGLLIILGTIFTYVSSVFTFIFLEALDKKKTEIKKAFNANSSIGLSFFLFRAVFGFILMVLILVLLLPIIIPLINTGFVGYFDNFQLISLIWILPCISVIVILMMIAALFMSLVHNFSALHMYFHRLPAVKSIKETFKKMNEQKLEVLLFLVARLLLGVVAGLAAIIILIAMFLPFIIILMVFGAVFYLLWLAIGWNIILIASAVLVGVIILVFSLYVFSVAFLPVSVFSMYFSIRNYKALMKK